MRKTFTASGQYSNEFFGMRGGFDVGVTIDAGTVSISIEKELGGVWYAVGAAITATGTLRHLSAGVDYTAGQKFRLNCTALATGPTQADYDGDIVAAEISQLNAGSGGRITDDGDDRITDNGDYRVLEAA